MSNQWATSMFVITTADKLSSEMTKFSLQTICGCRLMVNYVPSKHGSWVRFPSSATTLKLSVQSIPAKEILKYIWLHYLQITIILIVLTTMSSKTLGANKLASKKLLSLNYKIYPRHIEVKNKLELERKKDRKKLKEVNSNKLKT